MRFPHDGEPGAEPVRFRPKNAPKWSFPVRRSSQSPYAEVVQSPYSDIASISRADAGGTVTPWISDGFTGVVAVFTGAAQCGAMRAQSPRSSARLTSDSRDSRDAVCFDISAP